MTKASTDARAPAAASGRETVARFTERAALVRLFSLFRAAGIGRADFALLTTEAGADRLLTDFYEKLDPAWRASPDGFCANFLARPDPAEAAPPLAALMGLGVIASESEVLANGGALAGWIYAAGLAPPGRQPSPAGEPDFPPAVSTRAGVPRWDPGPDSRSPADSPAAWIAAGFAAEDVFVIVDEAVAPASAISALREAGPREIAPVILGPAPAGL